MKQCIDLKQLLGEKYKVACEESYWAERGHNGRAHDPWLLTIPCRHGHIYPHGGTKLGASTNSRGPIANRLAALPCVRLVQDGDDGVNVVFDAGDFDQVAAVMRPKRRRRLTPEQRQERSKRLLKYQFGSATHDAGSDRRRDPSEVAASQVA